MPKGKTAQRRLLQELKEVKAQLAGVLGMQAGDLRRDHSRVPIRRATSFDWECPCGFYCYSDRERCPKCDRSKGLGLSCPGFRRRLFVGTQGAHERAERVQPQARVPTVPERRQQQQPQQPQQPQPQRPLSQIERAQPQLRQQARSYVEAARAAQAAPPPTQVAVEQNCNSNREPKAAAGTAAIRQLGLQQPQPPPADGGQTPGQPQYAQVHPVGPLPRVDALQNSAVVHHEIHSQGNDEWHWGDDEPEDGTVEELDPQVTDIKRIQGKMRGVTQGIQRRANRLEKAQLERDAQRQAVEQAQALLQVKEDAVAAAEADLRHLREVHADLAKKHAELSEAEAMRDRVAGQQVAQENQLQSTKQVLWQAATSIRGLGADPRIEAALAALESLFNEVAVDRRPPQQQVAAQLPPLVHEPPQPATAAPITPTGVQPTVHNAPQNHGTVVPNPSSVAAALPAPAPVQDVEMDEERGKKRTCQEAAMPERTADGQQKPEALLVDSSGKPAKLETAAAACATQSAAMVVDADGVVHAKPPPVQPTQAATVRGDGTSDTGALKAPAGDGDAPEKEQSAEEAAKKESRASFSALVKTACSRRSYPY